MKKKKQGKLAVLLMGKSKAFLVIDKIQPVLVIPDPNSSALNLPVSLTALKRKTLVFRLVEATENVAYYKLVGKK